MKTSKLFFTFLLGVLVGAAGYWFYSQNQGRSHNLVVNAREDIHETATRVDNSVKQTFDKEKIKEELDRTGRVVREGVNKAGTAVSDAASNVRITSTIKTKLLADEGLAALKIDVDTNDGIVTLSGNVSSHDDIIKAMQLALDTDGVKRVVSTLQVKQ